MQQNRKFHLIRLVSKHVELYVSTLPFQFVANILMHLFCTSLCMIWHKSVNVFHISSQTLFLFWLQLVDFWVERLLWRSEWVCGSGRGQTRAVLHSRIFAGRWAGREDQCLSSSYVRADRKVDGGVMEWGGMVCRMIDGEINCVCGIFWAWTLEMLLYFFIDIVLARKRRRKYSLSYLYLIWWSLPSIIICTSWNSNWCC